MSRAGGLGPGERRVVVARVGDRRSADPRLGVDDERGGVVRAELVGAAEEGRVGRLLGRLEQDEVDVSCTRRRVMERAVIMARVEASSIMRASAKTRSIRASMMASRAGNVMKASTNAPSIRASVMTSRAGSNVVRGSAKSRRARAGIIRAAKNAAVGLRRRRSGAGAVRRPGDERRPRGRRRGPRPRRSSCGGRGGGRRQIAAPVRRRALRGLEAVVE